MQLWGYDWGGYSNAPKLTPPDDRGGMTLSDVTVKQAKPKTKAYKSADGGGLFLLATAAGESGGVISTTPDE